MRVADLMAVLGRFPADARVAVGDMLAVDGTLVVGDGELLFRVLKGTKGLAGLDPIGRYIPPAARLVHEHASTDPGKVDEHAGLGDDRRDPPPNPDNDPPAA